MSQRKGKGISARKPSMRSKHPPHAVWQKALDSFAAEMHALYGTRLSQIVLYGSRARNEAEGSSDIDVLVILDPLQDFWKEFSRISPVASRISLEHSVVISAIPASLHDFQDPKTPLMLNVGREGIAVG